MPPAGRDWTRPILLLILVLALLPRLGAVRFNTWPHGDVLLDAAVADSLVQHGEFKVPLVDVRFYPTGRFGFGYPPDQHPPLWPLLGAAVGLVWRDGYQALKLVSLVAGLLLVPAVYCCGRDLFGRGPGLFAAALCAVSYLLIDFSGNGSLWSLLALLYVLFVWRAACGSLTDRRNALLLGLLMAAGYLTNYPAVVLPLSFVALLVARPLARRVGAGHAPPEGSGGACPAPTARLIAPLPLAVAGLLALPWMVFNFVTFGNPVWSQPLERQLGGGDKQTELVVQDGEVVKRKVGAADPLTQRLRSTARDVYGNVGFLVRQSFVLAPFMGGFVLAGLAALSMRALRGGAARELPLLLLTFAHTGLILLWPTTKFRYLVPLFPLAVLIGSWLLWQIKPPDLRTLLAAVGLGLACLTSLWTFASIPSHTYYYDGGVVSDNFGAQGEIAYVEDLRRLEQAATAIRAEGPGVVLGPHALYAMARQPLVVNSDAYSAEIVARLVARYDVRYVVADVAKMEFYSAALPGRVLWRDEKFAVYEVT